MQRKKQRRAERTIRKVEKMLHSFITNGNAFQMNESYFSFSAELILVLKTFPVPRHRGAFIPQRACMVFPNDIRDS